MRISDWSSDVCSSDLQRAVVGRQPRRASNRLQPQQLGEGRFHQRVDVVAIGDLQAGGRAEILEQQEAGFDVARQDARHTHVAGFQQDRKSVVSGKSVSVRVDLGGRRIIKKTNTYHTTSNYLITSANI